MNKNNIALLGPSLENSIHANTKSLSGNVILQNHTKCKDYDRSIMHFKVSALQRKLVVHGIISMSLLIYSGCSLSPTEHCRICFPGGVRSKARKILPDL